MNQETIKVISDQIVSNISFWTALIGLLGVVIGAFITGLFSFIQNKQTIVYGKLEKKKELLLCKFELMYQELECFIGYVNEVAVLSINSIDSGYNPIKLESSLKNNKFIMYSNLYCPELSALTKEMQTAFSKMVVPLSKLIVNPTASRKEKELMITESVKSSLTVLAKIEKIKQELSSLTEALINE